MLETGNKTHMTVAFFPRIEREVLATIRDAAVEFAKAKWSGEDGRASVLPVLAAVKGKWGRSSVLMLEDSEIVAFATAVNERVLAPTGIATDNRPFHIEVVKKSRQMAKAEDKARGGRGGRGGGRGRRGGNE